MHGDEVKMGETVLSFHIHSGTDTCDGCEPGQVMAHLSKYRREEKAGEEAKFYSRPEWMISQLQVFNETLYSLQDQLFPKKIKKPWDKRSWSRWKLNMVCRWVSSGPQPACLSFKPAADHNCASLYRATSMRMVKHLKTPNTKTEQNPDGRRWAVRASSNETTLLLLFTSKTFDLHLSNKKS